MSPDELFGKPSGRSRSSRKPDRKALQLCGQVCRTLSLVLSGEFADPVLQNLLVDSVVPAPDATRLLVTVIPASGSTVDPATVMDRLGRVRGLLRREVAAAVVRKRAPELTFHVLQPPPDTGAAPGEVRP